MKANHSAMIQPTTMTVLSGLTILLAATWTVGSMELDQSGQSMALVSGAFRTATGLHRDEFKSIAISQTDLSNPAPARSRLPQPLDMTVGETKKEPDPAEVFASLLSELERIAGNSRNEAPVHEVQINLIDKDPANAVSLIRKIHGSLDDTGFLTTRERLQFEIQTWAASPTQDAWMDAVQDASRLQQKIDRGLSATESLHFTTQSSAALWPHTNHARPAMTIVVKVPVR